MDFYANNFVAFVHDQNKEFYIKFGIKFERNGPEILEMQRPLWSGERRQESF